jgi:serine/threonine-protein kinase
MSHKSRRRLSIPPSVSGHQAIDFSAREGREGTSRVPLPFQGMTVAGRYRIERRIAAGAMGEVWLGVHSELRLRVAIKTLRKEMVDNQEIVARFSREAFLLGRIQSDHVVRVLDFVVDRRLGPLLVTEFIDGPSLAKILASRRLTVEEGIDLAIDVLSGLRELHRARIVHRDVKPQNVVMRPLDDRDYRAVFVDLGVSRLVPEADRGDDGLTEITTADRAVGTVEYMAPEQILSSRNVTSGADLYAVGAILYRAVAGEHAFGEVSGVDLMKRKLSTPAPPLRTGRSDRVAKGFEELVARALAASPLERYEVADEMLADASLLRDAARRAARTATTPPRAPREGQRPADGSAGASSIATAAKRTARDRSARTAVLCAAAGLAVGVAVGVVTEGRLPGHDKQPVVRSVQLRGEGCTVLPSAPAAPGAPPAFTVVCDAPHAQ